MMKGIFPLTLSLLLVFISEGFAQTSDQQFVRRNCSFVGSPIIDPGHGIIIGKAVKITKPRIKGKLKKLSQGAIIEVKIEVDKTGKVTYAQAEEGIAELQNISEQAARSSEFNPTLVDGVPSKIKGKVIYKFNRRQTDISNEFESPEREPQPIDYEAFKLRKNLIRKS